MLDSINCEPYGHINHNPDDLDNTIINEVEDIEQITEDIEIIEVEQIEVNTNINIDYIKLKETEIIDIKLPKDLSLDIPSILG